VTGLYDFVERIKAWNLDELSRLVVSRVHTLGGVARAMTCRSSTAWQLIP
jgi:hypothetical protein